VCVVCVCCDPPWCCSVCSRASTCRVRSVAPQMTVVTMTPPLSSATSARVGFTSAAFQVKHSLTWMPQLMPLGCALAALSSGVVCVVFA